MRKESKFYEPRFSLAGLRLSLTGEDPEHLNEARAEEILIEAIQESWDDSWDDSQDIWDIEINDDLRESWGEYVEHAKERGATFRSASSAREDHGMVVWDDEDFRFFKVIGIRSLLAGMLLQSIRDMVALQNQQSSGDVKDIEEICTSAQWIDTQDGRMAIKMLFPNFSEDEIILRIKTNPEEALKRFSAWASMNPDPLEIIEEAHRAESFVESEYQTFYP